MIFFDVRWLGSHGIGRFCGEVGRRLTGCVAVEGVIKPTNPFDAVYQSAKVLFCQGGLWFSPGYNAPLVGLARYVFVVHDLNHIDVPTNGNWAKRLYYSLVMLRACRKAARVLTVSEYSRRRIIEWAKVPSGKVINVGNGVAEAFRPNGPQYNPGYRYVLCVSNRKAHKNELRAVRAFAQARISRDVRMVFTGLPGGGVLELASELGVTKRIMFLGKVEEEHLPSVYRGALALVFPSLYEGFGLPVVEAMACGTPVLTSNTTSLPEVAGKAAVLVDPLSEDSIAEGLERILSDETLRCSLIERGLERVKLYRWDSVAEKVQAVLDQVKAELEQGR